MAALLPTTTKEEREKVKAHLKEIYDSYRAASMNCTYYQRRLKNTQRIAKLFELSIAVLTSGTVASWAIWKTSFGANTWSIIGGASCILSIAHPILKLSDHIERLTKQRTGYNDIYHDLKDIVCDIQTNQGLPTQTWKSFRSINERFKKLAETDDPDPSKKKLDKIMAEVIREVPTESLWYPKAL